MLQQLPEYQRASIGEFLTAYANQTKKISISLSVFVTNAIRAFIAKKFGFQHMFNQLYENYSENDKELELKKELQVVFNRSRSKLTDRKSFSIEDKLFQSSKANKSQLQRQKKESKKTNKFVSVKLCNKQEVQTDKINEINSTTKKQPLKNYARRNCSKQRQLDDDSIHKYSKIAKKKNQERAAPISSYEKPTKSYLFRSKVGQSLHKRESISIKNKNDLVSGVSLELRTNVQQNLSSKVHI